MNKKANKKNIAGRFLVAGFFVLVTFFSLQTVSQVQAVTGDYNKAATSTLTAFEWNNLISDFISNAGGRINGSLGINTATSTYALDINGLANFTQPVIVGTPTGSTHATTKSYVDSLIAGGAGSTVGYWQMNGANINNSNAGNVGIGTSTPLAKLDVIGAVRSTQNANGYSEFTHKNAGGGVNFPRSYFRIYGGGSETNSALYVAPGNAIGTTMQPVFLGLSTNSNVKQAGSKQALFYLTNSAFSFVTADAENSGGTKIPWYFGGTQVSGADANLAILANGNVGIGLTNPIYKLDVAGASQFSQPVIVGTPTIASHAVTKSYVDSLMSSSVGVGTSGQTLRNNGTSWVADSNLFNTGTNIGIGTTNPSAPFSIVSSSDVDTFSLTNQALSANIGFVLRLPLSTGTNDGKAFGFYAGNESWTRGLFYSDGAYGIGPGNATRDIFLRRYSANNLMIDSNKAGGVANLLVTGNIGIGLTNPSYQLDVAGTSRFNQPVIVGTPTGATHATTKSYVDSLLTGGSGSAVGYWTMNGTNINNNNGGNVGIGTTNPGKKLDVFGALSTADAVIRANYNNDVIMDMFSSPGGYGNIGTVSNYPLNLTVNNLKKLTIDTAGNVGIGTNTPESKLHIYGDSPILTVQANTSSGVNANPSIFLKNTQANAGFKFYYDGASTGNTYFDNYFTSGSMVFRTAVGGTPVTAMTINSFGNIGINVSPQTNKLSIAGSVATTTVGTESIFSLIKGDTGPSYPQMASFNLGRYALPTAYSPNSRLDINLKNSINSSLIADVTVMSLQSNGNVGIGTTTTAYKLDIAGTGHFTQPVIVGTPTGATHAVTKSYVDSLLSSAVGAGITGQTLRNDGTGWVANSTLFNNGTNIGIGITNPGSKMHIGLSGSDSTIAPTTITRANEYLHIGKQEYNTNSYRLIGFGYTQNTTTSSPAYIGFQETNTGGETLGDLIFGTRSVTSDTQPTERMRIASSGNIGIGTTVPNQLLEVAGSTSTIKISDTTSTRQPQLELVSGTIDTFGADGYTDWRMYIAGGDLRFLRQDNGGNSGDSITFGALGNLGIGITNPVYKLDVTGTGQFTQPVIVGTPTGATHATTKSYVDSLLAGGSGSTVGYWTMNGTNISNSNSGNVGIGTTNPLNKLDIKGASVIGGTYAGTYTAPANGLLVQGGILAGGDVTMLASVTNQLSGVFTTQSSLNTNETIGPYAFQSGSGSNNIVIGTMAGRFKAGNNNLFIGSGAGRYMNDGTQPFPASVSSSLYIGDNTRFSGVGISNEIVIGANSYGAGSNTVTLGNSSITKTILTGNVGIGLTNPAYKLDVTGTGQFTQPLIVGTPTGATHATTKSYVDSLLTGGSGSTVGYWTMNGTNISNSNSGNIGIGNTAPAYKLDISGSFSATASSSSIMLDANGNVSIGI